tara:strand:+ start:853 stop:1026 length:174 start_codon:yes stop_codon:yes gene_type:complete
MLKFLFDKGTLAFLASVPINTRLTINKCKVTAVIGKDIDEARKKCLAKSVPKTRGAK